MSQLEKINFGEWALLGADGLAVCDYDSVLEVAKESSSQVLTEPIENGQLAAYNKVQQPDAVRVTLSLGNDPATQAASLAKLKTLKQGTGTAYLCTLVSSADVTDSLALENISQSHTATAGATLLVVELAFVRVRTVLVSSSKVSWAPKKATSADQVNQGKVQSVLHKTINN